MLTRDADQLACDQTGQRGSFNANIYIYIQYYITQYNTIMDDNHFTPYNRNMSKSLESLPSMIVCNMRAEQTSTLHKRLASRLRTAELRGSPHFSSP